MERERVLVIDDNVELRKLVERTLTDIGLEVQVANDAEEAVALVARQAGRPDLILCDMNLPGMSGLEFVRAVRAMQWMEGVPILGISGFTDVYTTGDALGHGCDAYLSKPIDQRVLVDLVTTSLTSRRRARLLEEPASPQ